MLKPNFLSLNHHTCLALSILALTGCQSLPKNMGIASSGSEIGLVYVAKVKAIYPIFVKPDYAENSYSGGVGSIAEAITENIFESSSSVFQLSNIASSLAQSATGVYEERFAGLYCHYILEISGRDLIDDINSSNNNNNESFSNNVVNNFSDNVEVEVSKVQSTLKIDAVEIDKNSGFTTGPQDEVVTQKTSSSETPTKTTSEVQKKKRELPNVFVTNPCRNFKISSKVTVSKSNDTVILQPLISFAHDEK